MFQRACRLLQPSEPTPAHTTERSPSAAAAARLSESERLSRWKALCLRLYLILQTAYQTNKAKILLGAPVYNRMFQSKQELAVRGPVNYRFVNGQVVGKPLPPGKGDKDTKKPLVDPAICAHNDRDLMSRANKTTKWWTCKKCLSRWERLEVSEVTSESVEPQPQDLVICGKHTGETYLEVCQKDPAYCKWLLQSMEAGEIPEQLKRLAIFVLNQQLAETYEADPYLDMDEEMAQL